MTEREDRGQAAMTLAERIDPAARSRMRVREFDGVPVIEAALPGPFRAVFTTRLGGESDGGFASLNLSPWSGDDPLVVESNRARMERIAGRRLVSPTQAHGLRVVGVAEYIQEKPDSPCDGLTLHLEIDKGLAALLLYADCVPLVLCGEVDMAVAHAGWRGILGGMAEQATRALMGMAGTAVIGPSIGPCCFTVGEDVASAFAGRFGPEVVIRPPADGGPPRVDLWAATARALREAGISPSQIVNPRICTACNTDLFYSYRVEGPVTGRHGCLGWVESP
ncbi:MAG: laccase domain-containing protein [Thermoleophilia bacterium]|nr:laccase domain-containing protein [Thermoleophilia bacterium]